MDERAPADGIRHHLEVIRLLSDDELIARITGLEPLPDADDDDPAWRDDATWDRAEFLLAAADAIGERKLVRAIAPLLQRAALGDGYEMMPGIRHGPERAVAPDWQRLTSIMRPLTRDQRAGCRRWAIRELGILRDPQALDDLLSGLHDNEPLVRCEACTSLAMLSQAAPRSRPRIRTLLQATAQHDTCSEVRRQAKWASETIT
jgi:HEAT repeat protein